MADERDDSQERSEEATPKRLEQAREKGQISRSRELNTMAVLMGSAIILFMFGHSMIQSLLYIMRNGFVLERDSLFDDQSSMIQLTHATESMLSGMAPFLVGITIIAIIAPMVVGGWIFSAEAVKFKWNKLDPIAGTKRLFSLKSLMELLKALAKFCLVIGTLSVLLWYQTDDLLHMGQGDLNPSLLNAAQFILWSFIILSSTTILIALVDVPFQLWDHKRQLKMTKQEVRDEMKDTEGKPEVKSQIRALQRELATRRMMEDVQKADVIVTNPTHFAIALIYERDTMRAPRLVAKGKDLIAMRIQNVGREHGVVIFSSPLLARALFHTTKIGQEIPEGLYIAVAQVLAYVYQLRTSRRWPDAERPRPPGDLPIPDNMRYD
ncbi:MAG: flagellar biosynthesis protein FlhB [Thiotrichales bacterium]|nr:flagellar biosynthesis protein FlhB [Thiotrichales bacterium]